MSATKQFNLTEEEIAAIVRALRVRINDLHRFADNLDASDDHLRKQVVDLSILHDKLAAGTREPTSGLFFDRMTPHCFSLATIRSSDAIVPNSSLRRPTPQGPRRVDAD